MDQYGNLTSVQSCKNHGIDPYAYLKDILERLPSMTNQQIHTLTVSVGLTTPYAG